MHQLKYSRDVTWIRALVTYIPKSSGDLCQRIHALKKGEKICPRCKATARSVLGVQAKAEEHQTPYYSDAGL